MAMFGFRRKQLQQDEWERPHAVPVDYTPERARAAVNALESINAEEAYPAAAVDEFLDQVVRKLDRAVYPAPLKWTLDEPACRGVYWHAATVDDIGSLELRQVLGMGSQFCCAVRRPNSDSVCYLGVQHIGGYWAGPIPLPEGVDATDVNMVLP